MGYSRLRKHEALAKFEILNKYDTNGPYRC